MTFPMLSSGSAANLWAVFTLFLIPIGGGIPAGVLLAQSKQISWIAMLVLYFLSDVVLALLFEPLMLLVIAAGRRSPFFARIAASMKKTTQKTIAYYSNGTHLGPLALIAISFGVDPMTGRAATVAAGHGFVAGWMLAILGDMVFFALLMASTLWLHSILGDGTWATIIILVVMMIVPYLVRKARETWRGKRAR